MAAPSPAKKTAAKKTSASVAARREVRGEGKARGDVVVPFRGAKFTITRDRLGSARVAMRSQFLSRFRTVDAEVDLLFEILGKVDSARFIDLCEPGDDLEGVALEFLNALNKASGIGPGKAS